MTTTSGKPIYQTPRIDLPPAMDALQRWRNADHEDSIRLSRDDVVLLIEETRQQLASERQARIDAEAAVALVVERGQRLMLAAKELSEFASYSEIVGGISVNRRQVREWCDKVFAEVRGLPEDEDYEPSFSALASPSGVEELAKLRAREREAAMQALASMGQAQEAYEAQKAAEADRDDLRARLAAMQAQTDQMTAAWGRDAVEVEELRALVKVLTEAVAISGPIALADFARHPFILSDDEKQKVSVIEAALAAATPPAAQEGGA